MDRKELITSLEYAIGIMDSDLSNTVGNHMMIEANHQEYKRIMNAEFCEKSKQITRLVEICIANGFIPVLKLVPVAEYIAEDERKAQEVKNGK